MGPECPTCSARLKGGTCPECGWQEPTKAKFKCVVCNEQPPWGPYVNKCRGCGRCRGKTEMGQCTFRAETFDGRSGYCGWHNVVRYDDELNRFEEFERWCGLLRKRSYCDRWTHFPPSVLWDGMAGARGSEQAEWCGGDDCPHRPVQPLPAYTRGPIAVTPKAPATDEPKEDHRAKVLEQARLLRG